MNGLQIEGRAPLPEGSTVTIAASPKTSSSSSSSSSSASSSNSVVHSTRTTTTNTNLSREEIEDQKKHEKKLELLKAIANLKDDPLSSQKLADSLNWPHDKTLVGILKSVEASGLIKTKPIKHTSWKLSQEAQSVIENGSPEVRIWKYVVDSSTGVTKQQLEEKFGAKLVRPGFGQCMRAKWLRLDKKSGMVVSLKDSIGADRVQEQLKAIAASSSDSVDKKDLAQLKKRTFISQENWITYEISKCPATFTTDLPCPIGRFTSHVLESGEWKKRPMKPFNLNALGMPLASGHLHPLMKVCSEFRQIFLEMGFQEMPTARYVENGFWNFDALFQPQQHPARDAHDTFFVRTPKKTTNLPQDYLERVKTMHEKGGNGSIGWRYNWALQDAQLNIMRTHTTAVSSRMLYQLGQDYAKTGQFTPKKYFSIDKVFRNETLDATHLAEFHQIEGLIADRGLTLGNLIAVIREFFEKLGIKKLRFKPAYNPYTEPSMEVFSYHEGLKKWIELGNSGMFRPEMLLPMELPDDVRVIAWGLSLERPTMIKYGMDNIRDLVGHKLDLGFVQKFPIVRLDTLEKK